MPEEAILLGKGEEGSSAKDRGVTAGDNGVQEEEGQSIVVRSALCSRGEIGLSV